MRLFNFDEILTLAEKVEQVGEKFYVTAAEVCPRHKDFLLMLAEQEKVHRSIFSDMRNSYATPYKRRAVSSKDPEGTFRSYLHAVADGMVSDTDENPDNFCLGKDNIEDIIDLAILREEETILFFNGLKELLDEEGEKKLVDDLIKEETSHIAWLNRERKTLVKHHPLL